MKIRTTAVVFVGVLTVVAGAPAAPVIKDYSSTGGNPVNKTNLKDTMYLVKSGDKITFGVKADGADKYVWQVNKRVDKQTGGSSFTWNVPDEKGIWEIHVTAGGKDGEVHQEWAVSTLSNEEAPTFFDYFTDKRYEKREQTDPWGRPLVEWKAQEDNYDLPRTSRGWMEPGKGGQRPFSLLAPSHTAYGTWRFLFQFPMGYFVPPNSGSGPRTQIYYSFIRDKEGSHGHVFHYNKVSDSHNYFFHRSDPVFESWLTLGDEDSGFKQRCGWYAVTIVRTPDGWINTYVTDIEKDRTYLQFRGYTKTGETCSYVEMLLNRPLWDMFPRVTVYVDGLEIYKDKYLFPAASASFGKYVENWQWRPQPIEEPEIDSIGDWKDFHMREFTQAEIDQINKRHGGYNVTPERIKGWIGRELREMRWKRDHYPVHGEGIVVRGKGMTLEAIGRMLNDPAKFRYDPQKQAWICNADLVVDEGAELIIRDTALRMHCEKPGQHKIAVMYGATVRISKSTITSDTPNYFLWRFTGAANYGYNLGMETMEMNALSYGSFGSFLAEDSTIDNCANLFLDAPREVRLRNVRLTRLHQADAGEYSAPENEIEMKLRKQYVKGPKSFCLFLKNYNVFLFDLDGMIFSSAGKPTDVTFLLNSNKNRLNVCNSDFGDENILVRPSVKMMSFWDSNWPEYYDSVLGLVNCKFKSIRVTEDQAFAVPKYYLDVKVVNGSAPVARAKVAVVCENPDGKYPPENLLTAREYRNNDPRLSPIAIKMGQPMFATTTTANGHTPLPSDQAGVLVLPDFVQDKSGKKEFTYTITVEKDGQKKVVTGVNPGPEWYRADPNKPTYTITAVLDGKTVTEAELKK